jgi:hypothetical protein
MLQLWKVTFGVFKIRKKKYMTMKEMKKLGVMKKEE